MPVFVFEGVNKVGKTTTVNAVEKLLKEKTDRPIKRLKFPTPEYWKDRNSIDISTPAYQRIMIHQIGSVADIHNGMAKTDEDSLYLVDRYTYSNLAYTYALAMKTTYGNTYRAISAVQELEYVIRSLELPSANSLKGIPTPDLVFYLNPELSTIMQRFKESPPPSIQGVSIDYDVALDVIYGFCRQPAFKKFRHVETLKKTPEKIAKEIVSQIMGVVKSRPMVRVQ